MSRKFEIIASFSSGFGERKSTDLINGLFVAFRKLRLKPPFDFESRGSLGVDSKEISRILFFNEMPKTTKNHENFFKAGKALSKFPSDEIAWVAQYLIDGENHLFPEEAKKAIELNSAFRLPGSK